MSELVVETADDQSLDFSLVPAVDGLSTIISGAELRIHLQAMPPGRSALNSGFTFNRAVKVLHVNGLLPADSGQISYGLMKAQQKAQLHDTVKRNFLSHERIILSEHHSDSAVDVGCRQHINTE
jgi:hypothetical protein